jgi:hypothetical protein
VMLNDRFRMLGELPSGVPDNSPEYAKTVLPAAAFGRGVIAR